MNLVSPISVTSSSGKIKSLVPIEALLDHQTSLLKSAEDVVKDVNSIIGYNDPMGIYAYCPFVVTQ